jgi:hypothetical protein
VFYQREARGADHLITNATDAHVQGEQRRDDDEDGSGGALVPAGLWRAKAGKISNDFRGLVSGRSKPALTWALTLGAGDGNRTRTISLGTGLSYSADHSICSS